MTTKASPTIETRDDWVINELNRVSREQDYEMDRLIPTLQLIQGGFGVAQIRDALNSRLKAHQYSVVSVYAKYLAADWRVSYRKLGEVFLRKTAKAPTVPEEELRKRDRQAAGETLFQGKFRVSNPWGMKPKEREETVIRRVYAKDLEDARMRMTSYAETMYMAGQVKWLFVRSVTDADMTDVKAAVTKIILKFQDPDLGEKIVDSFEDANTVLRWTIHRDITRRPIPCLISLEWEHGMTFGLNVRLTRDDLSHPSVLKHMVSEFLTWMLDMPDYAMSPVDRNHRAALKEQDAHHHCEAVRNECLLDDVPTSPANI